MSNQRILIIGGVAGGASAAARVRRLCETCEIVVSDNGPGVPPELAERIFRFWDRGGRDGSDARGYGMGLAIARHLARAMVGDLVYRPHHPSGSEFVLSLPLSPRRKAEDPLREDEASAVA